MIEQSVFKDWWELLCERFNRQPSRVLSAAYYKSLSPRLTTEQFQAAARRIFDGAEFFPKPDDFLERAEMSTEAVALSQWDVVHDLMRGFDVHDRLTEESRRIVRMLGGESQLRMTPLDRVGLIRRDFLAMYGDAVEIAAREASPAIEAGDEAKQIAASVAKSLPSVVDLDEARRRRTGS